MKFPFFVQLLKALMRRPETNPFPAAHLPGSVGGFLKDVQEGRAKMNPPVPMTKGGRARVVYSPEGCIGCQMCIKVCPAHAIEWVAERKKIRLFRGGCIACGQCVEVCPKGCLAMDQVFLQADTDRYSSALVSE